MTQQAHFFSKTSETLTAVKKVSLSSSFLYFSISRCLSVFRYPSLGFLGTPSRTLRRPKRENKTEKQKVRERKSGKKRAKAMEEEGEGEGRRR